MKPSSVIYSLSFLLLSLGAALSGVSLHAEESASQGRTLLDWTEQAGSDSAKSPSSDIKFFVRHGAQPIIATAQTTPPSPFSNGSAALYIPPSGNAEQAEAVAIDFDPFLYQHSPARGWIELEFAVQNSIFDISLGVDSTNMESPSTMTQSSVGKKLFTAYFFPQENRTILLRRDSEQGGGDPQRIPLSRGIIPGQPHVFRISWDWKSDMPGIRFQLDGEPLSIKGGDETLPVDIKSIEKGVDQLVIFLRSGDFLGKITASE